MKTKLDNYRIFHEVAHCLSFSKASERLYISQSAVSQSIKQLETDLDTKLFKRYAKGVLLTKEGEILFDYIKTALSAIDVAEKKLYDMKNLEEGTLIIGAGDTISHHYLLPYLEKFHTLFPNIRLQVYNRTSLEMLDLVKSGRVDVAFINLPIKDRDLNIHSCFDIHDIFVCSPQFERNAIYSYQDIANMPLILLEKNANSRYYIDQHFKKHHITLQPQIEIGAHELLLQFAKINLGVSCVIKEFSQTQLKTGELIELKLSTPIPKRSIGYAFNKSIPLSSAAKSFLAFIK
ncbi:MAG: LysR family transcriptional regulator [Erysipelotrichia bacterium]|nr:LysR family transcriptional regulator [Erysipelotrichia bacterium]NCC54355.1 LysR family transcriptional regulator [Erysipelotrichia bacterium]